MPHDYTNLRRILESERFPHTYVHKIIGRNTPAFEQGIANFEARFPRAVRATRRESQPKAAAAASPSARFISYSFELEADTADEIIELLVFTETIADTMMQL